MTIKIGLGLYPHLMNWESFAFAAQAGATHIVAHLPGWARRVGRGLPPDAMWTEDELGSLKRAMNDAGLEFYAIENFEVEHWYDVLLDGPRRDEQIANLQGLLRTMGRLGISVMGYNFSYANVWGRVMGPYARGGARTPAYLAWKPHPKLQSRTAQSGECNTTLEPEKAPLARCPRRSSGSAIPVSCMT